MIHFISRLNQVTIHSFVPGSKYLLLFTIAQIFVKMLGRIIFRINKIWSFLVIVITKSDFGWSLVEFQLAAHVVTRETQKLFLFTQFCCMKPYVPSKPRKQYC